MDHKFFLLLQLILLSFVFSLNKVEIPFKMDIGSFYPSFKVKVGSSSTQYDFSFSLNIPCLLFHHSDSYDETGTEVDKNINIYSYPLIDKTTAKLIKNNLIIDPSSKNIDLGEVEFLSGQLIKDSANDRGIIGLAPKINEDNFGIKESYSSYNILQKTILNQNIFSINNTQNLDGSYGGSIFLGFRHTDFQTKEGESVSCQSKNDYKWGCNFKSLRLDTGVINFNSDDSIIFSSEYTPAIFKYSYIKEFLKILPDGLCSEEKSENYTDAYIIKCDKWSINELELKLDLNDNLLKVKIPDINNIANLGKKHYKFTPFILFSTTATEISIPLLWFKNYHILFDKNEKTITFHTTDDDLIETKGEKKQEAEKETNNIKISTTAFVFLCIALGIVFVAIIMFIGYLRLTNQKPTRGLKTKQTGQKKKAPRTANFDSALLGTSNDSMPKRYKTIAIK